MKSFALFATFCSIQSGSPRPYPQQKVAKDRKGGLIRLQRGVQDIGGAGSGVVLVAHTVSGALIPPDVSEQE